jgi:hypothetical protein
MRIDGQPKYGALTRNDGGAYMHLPGAGYVEMIWVHDEPAL